MNQTALNEKQLLHTDFPRQKLLSKGIHSLTDAELIALLIGTGTQQQSALSLAQTLMDRSDRNLHELAKKTAIDLMKIPGIGEAKALSIIVAFEIGRRKTLAEIPERIKIASSKDVYQFFSFLADYHHEEFWILLLRRNNTVIGKQRISNGGTAGTVVDTKLVFKTALDFRASFIMLCHNHPSGTMQPSQEDIKITNKLCQAGKLFDIDVMDHIIVAGTAYYSFSDEGILNS